MAKVFLEPIGSPIEEALPTTEFKKNADRMGEFELSAPSPDCRLWSDDNQLAASSARW
jgi:hypothetical protein